MVKIRKTQFIELLHNFRNQFVAFISIVLFVTLSIASFVGLMWSGESIGNTIDGYFNEGNFFDYDLSFFYGINDEDINFIKSLDDFSVVEPCYATYGYALKNSDKYQLKIGSINSTLNIPTYLDGYLPNTEEEIVLDKIFAEKSGYKIGDVIDFNFPEENSEEVYFSYLKNLDYDYDNFFELLLENEVSVRNLKKSKFTVTGIIKISEYVSTYADTYGVNPKTGCPISGVAYVCQDAFNKKSYMGYSSLMIKCDTLTGLNRFSKEYLQKLENIEDRNDNVLNDHFHSKYTNYSANLQNFINSIPNKLSDIEEQITSIGAYTQSGITLSYKKDILLSIKNYYDATKSSGFEYKYFLECGTANASYCGIKTVINVFSELKYSLCSLFVIVGTLVCFFAVSRNVFEQTKLIGTKKALGMTKGEIFSSLYFFSLISTILGIVLGALMSRFFVEAILVSSMQLYYSYNTILYVFNFKDILIFSVIEYVLIIGATYFAAASILKRSAKSLLLGTENINSKKRKNK